MMSTTSIQETRLAPPSILLRKYCHAALDHQPEIFTDIFQPATNMVIWQRELSTSLQACVKDFLAVNPTFQAEMHVTPHTVFSRLNESFGATEQPELRDNIAELVVMFCILFELKQAKLCLKVLDNAMCPKFHVDRVPCRLLTTYQGVATEWLPHEVVDRTKLGRGSRGQSDKESGLFQSEKNIQQLNCGDVGLLKGELWEGNENAGLVHRSPELSIGEHRLLLKLDFIQ